MKQVVVPKPTREDRTKLALERTRLANKRTFLAWCRTSLALIAFGIALEKAELFADGFGQRFTLLSEELRKLGFASILTGLVLTVTSGLRYMALEARLGFRRIDLYSAPEIILFCVILAGGLYWYFS